jgi:putative CRISPR-associated protein (TIGR02619 family)
MTCAMAKLIVSTCGTSLLTNTATDTLSLLRDSASLTAAELTGPQRTALDDYIEACVARLQSSSVAAAQHLSAELRGLVVNGDLSGPGGNDHHVLIPSDTYQGVRVAEIIAGWLGRHRSVEVIRVPGLVPTHLPNFRTALSLLALQCLELIDQHRAAGREIVFNLNGGFKAIQGFMQTLGCHCADECLYIFETGTEIMRIPRLPMTLDPDGVIGRHLGDFRMMAAGQALPAARASGIPETLLFDIDGEVLLSEWGEILWHNCRNRHYGERLLPPPIAAINYGPRFEKDASRLPPDRLVQLNRQIDAVAIYLVGQRRHNSRSLSFQQLKGAPQSGATHEFYAWSDRDAARCFGYFESPGGAFVVDRLGKHL